MNTRNNKAKYGISKTAIKERSYFDNLENVYDYWSTNSIKILKVRPNTNNSKKSIENQIKFLNKFKPKIEKFYQDFLNEKQKLTNKQTDFTTLLNIMPNGEQIIPQVPLKQIDSNDIDKSSEKFIELYKDVYYEDSKKYLAILTQNKSQFNDNFKKMLKNSYESFLCYPRLRLNNISLGGLSNLYSFFVEADTHNFEPNNFFQSFRKNTPFGLFFDEEFLTYPENLDNYDKNMFNEMNPNLWNISTNGTTKFTEGRDSYGIFFKRPKLLEKEQKATATYSGFGTPPPTTSILKYLTTPESINQKTGSVNLSDNSVYGFSPKPEDVEICLFLFTRYKDDREDFFDEKNTANVSGGNVFNNEINQYYFNYNKNAIKPEENHYDPSMSLSTKSRFVIDLKNSTPAPSSSYSPSTSAPTTDQYSKRKYIDSPEQLRGDEKFVYNLRMSGGSKKMKGGTKQKLFDITGIPVLYPYKRLLKFNKENFKNNMIANFDINKENKIKSIYRKLINLPLFYNTPSDSRIVNRESSSNADQKLSYGELREIFQFCNIVSNNFRLIRLFLKNILKCLEFVQLNRLQKKSNNNNNEKNKKDITSLLNTGIENIKKNIINACDIISCIICEQPSTALNAILTKNLFLGLDIELLEKVNGETLTDIFSKYMFYTSAGIDKQKFENILRKISSWSFEGKEVIFGGYSLVSVKYPNLNENVWGCYTLTVQERVKSVNNLINAFTQLNIKRNSVLANGNKQKKDEEVRAMLNKIFSDKRLQIEQKFNAVLADTFSILLRLIGTLSSGVVTEISDEVNYFNKKKSEGYKKLNDFRYRVGLIMKNFREKGLPIDFQFKYKLYLMVAYFEYYLKTKREKLGEIMASLKINVLTPTLDYGKLMNPNCFFPRWWFDNYLMFQGSNSTVVKKCFAFVCTINNTDKGKVVNFYLVDLFAAAFSNNISAAIKNDVNISNNKWLNDNIVIKIEPYEPQLEMGKTFLTAIGELFAQYKKFNSVNKNSKNLKRKLRNRFEQFNTTQLDIFGKYYKSFVPIKKLFTRDFVAEVPFDNILEVNEIQTGKLVPNLLCAYFNNELLGNIIKPIEDGSAMMRYPIYVLDDANDGIATKVFSNVNEFRKFAYEIMLNIGDNVSRKYLRDVKEINIPLQSPMDLALFSNKLMIKLIYDNIYNMLIANLKGQRPDSRLIHNYGLVCKQYIQEILI